MISVLWGLMGCFVLLLSIYIFSEDKRNIDWRTFTIGFVLQVVLGFIVFKWNVGMTIMSKISDGVNVIMDSGNEGLMFVFGELADPTREAGTIFVINVLSIMIFLSALISILYYFGIMQWVVRMIGGFISKVMRTGYVESTNAVTNIFLGMSQSAISVKPYLKTISRSQMFAIMVGGLASVSGAVLFGLIALGINSQYLLSSAIMSAPAGLMVAKLLIPETETLDTAEWKKDEKLEVSEDTKPTFMDALIKGSKEGVDLTVNCAMILISIIGLVALVNVFIGGVGSLIGLPELSLNLIFGYLFAPVAFLIGIPWSEAVMAGTLLGEKLILNEFVAFTSFSNMMDAFSEKSVAVMSFALAGFANIGSIGITIGIMLGIAPDRNREIQNMAGKALFASTVANLLNGAIVGMFFF